MDTKYIPPFVTLLAAAISCICSIIKQTDVTQALIRLLIVIVIFYIIGRVAQKLLLWVMELSKGNAKEEANENEGASPDEAGSPDADVKEEHAASGEGAQASQTGENVEMSEV